jgi:hypothetical protein
MSSTCFEPEGSFQEDGCIHVYRYGVMCLHPEITTKKAFHSSNSIFECVSQNYTVHVTCVYRAHYD